MLKIGIFFGGPSREREISFAGGRTVYDNLNKGLFEPVPIFMDSFGNFIKLDWQYIYKGSIRDFYPPLNEIRTSKFDFQVYAETLSDKHKTKAKQQSLAQSIGTIIPPGQLSQHIDFAFLALHGAYGEDGSIQGLLQFLGIPYTASGILPSAIGMDKAFQKNILQNQGFALPDYFTIQRKAWLNSDEKERKTLFRNLKKNIKLPCVIKAANQGSSIGAGVLVEDDFESFCRKVNDAFFIRFVFVEEWLALSQEEKEDYIRSLTDIREGIGIPLLCEDNQGQTNIIYHPDKLLQFIEKWAKQNKEKPKAFLVLSGLDKENEIIVEQFLYGKEFSCIVIRDDAGKVIALPPTEIIKGRELFDYRSKYLAGLSRKQTPINIADKWIKKIQAECKRLFTFCKFHTYARIDGFFDETSKAVYLNDPNTTSGMLPSSFFFHQAAEIGLNPSQFLTFIIRNSLAERINSLSNTYFFEQLLSRLDADLERLKNTQQEKIKVAVILGGYSTERHISVESGRNIYEKLASSDKYQPFPVFLTGKEGNYDLYEIPINVLLKDNADDIRDKVLHFKQHRIVENIKKEASGMIAKYAYQNQTLAPVKISVKELAQKADVVFIALHGRPGEDGHLQAQLEKYHIPYNGSGIATSQITIDKFATNQILRKNGFKLARQLMVYQKDYKNIDEIIAQIESQFPYPFIAKPSDDGCSSAVKKIKARSELEAFIELMFRKKEPLLPAAAQTLQLKHKEEFPMKSYFLVEELIEKGGADHFLEVTGGLLTHHTEEGKNHFSLEMFEPSETLAGEEVLSLEEKFLAGQGQNITPARYATDQKEARKIARKVKKDLKKVAEILHIEGYARIDAFVKIYKNGRIDTYVIEVNSLPGMTPATCIFHQSALNGYTPYRFIDQILTYAMQKKP